MLRLRFDNLYIVPIEPLEGLSPPRLYVPAHDSWGGLNDRFAIAEPGIMQIYANRFQFMSQYIGEGMLIHPESLLKEHFSRHSVKVRNTRVVHHLYRHGDLWKARFRREEGNDPSFAPSRPLPRWRFHIKKGVGEYAYRRLSLLWWRLGI